MSKQFFILFAFLSFGNAEGPSDRSAVYSAHQKFFWDSNQYEKNVLFTVHQKDSQQFVSAVDGTISDKGCGITDKLAIVTHGWRENKDTSWVRDLIGNLTIIRGGCVIFIDYSYYSNNPFYNIFLTHFAKISALVTRKLRALETEGFNPDNLYMFGHSAGARLVIDAAGNFGYQKVSQIDACEPAGPGFDFSSTTMPPQHAAKNVACIHTSALAGTFRRECHQDWIMGQCGRNQPADNFYKWIYCTFSNTCDSSEYYSHGLCPNFFNSAFKNDFVNNNLYNCGSLRPAIGAPDDFKMGYMESRRTPEIVGDFFAPTAVNAPWNVLNGTSIKIRSYDLLTNSVFD